jgi:hypothetical protein
MESKEGVLRMCITDQCFIMEKKKTYKITDLTIGSKIFVVNKQHAFAKKPGGKVLQGRVIAFVNQAGNIKVEFKLVGWPQVLSEEYYCIFGTVKQAIQSIKS